MYRPTTRHQTRTKVAQEPRPRLVKKRQRRQKEISFLAEDFKSSAVKVSSPTYALDFMSQLYELYQQRLCCDVILSSGEYEMSAHKVVLAASSEYFKSLFLGKDVDCDFVVLPPGISRENLELTITFLYTGTLYLNSDNVLLLLSAATELQIKPAIELCHQFQIDQKMPLQFNQSIFKCEKEDNNFEQLTEILIKEEVPSVDDVPNIVKSWPSSNDLQVCDLQMLASLAETKTVSLRTKPGRSKTRVRASKFEQNNARSKPDFSKDTKRSPKVQRGRSERRPCGLMHSVLASGSNCKRACNLGFQRNLGRPLHLKPSRQSLQSWDIKTARRLILRSKFTKLLSLSCSVDTLKIEDAVPGSCPGRLYFCPHCRRRFSHSSRYKAHILKLHPSHFRATNRYFNLRACHSSTDGIRSRSAHRCSSCRRPFLYLSNLRVHCRESHNLAKKDIYREIYRERKRQAREWYCLEADCRMRFTSAIMLKKHMANTHSSITFSCPDCKFTSQVEKIFIRHREERHGLKTMCHICGKGCYKPYLLREHLYIHHRIKDPSLKLLQCTQEGCGYECISKKRLEDHCRRHTLIKSLKCEICSKEFKHSIGLERHVRVIHQGIRPYICDQCGMAFGQEHELKTHTILHSNYKPHACDQCPYRSFNKSNLHWHLFTQHSVKTNSRVSVYNCDQCTFTSRHRGRYEDHLKKHRNIKDIQCGECGKMFFSKRNLYGHTMKVHRPKSLCCSRCHFSTAIRSKLREHMKKMHNQAFEGTEVRLSKA